MLIKVCSRSARRNGSLHFQGINPGEHGCPLRAGPFQKGLSDQWPRDVVRGDDGRIDHHGGKWFWRSGLGGGCFFGLFGHDLVGGWSVRKYSLVDLG